MKIKYVEKGFISPHFGRAYPQFRLALVRADLPKRVRRFVAIHELFHLHDCPTSWLWGEVKANLYAFIREPIGGVGCVWMTIFSMDRLKYYYERLRHGN